jgi:hypothetical protein
MVTKPFPVPSVGYKLKCRVLLKLENLNLETPPHPRDRGERFSPELWKTLWI